jgi:TPR repeat protein
MARLWYEKAAEQGYPVAQYCLGVMHAIGKGGLPVSKEKARLWYEKSAEQGYPWAQYNLGLMHSKGEGGPVSKEKARLWYEKAAEQGDPEAQYYLGLMHHKGEGGPVSYEHAFFWMTRAGEQGDEQAAAALEAVKSVCFSCGKTGKMKCCARCKCAYYCSRECQAAAWNSGHKAACKQIRRKQQSAN